MRIGIDLMGSDNSPSVLYEAVLKAASELDLSTTFVVLATQEVTDELSTISHPAITSTSCARIVFHSVSEFIAMDDEPLTAIRRKKGSSIVSGIHLLKKHQIDAFVSAGNTGALVTSAALYLPMLDGIHRPALLAVVPTQAHPVAVLDVGGNVYCKAHHLVEFAKMGSAYQQCCLGIAAPKIGLLNIGVESNKGTFELRQAYQLLKEYTHQHSNSRMQFLGNIEGREVFQGNVDVLVTDGFTGNVFLKTSEGVSSFIFERLSSLNRHASTSKTIAHIQSYFNYSEYPGAVLCGVEGIVIKCHGSSNSKGMYNGIKGAVDLIQKQLIAYLKKALEADVIPFP